MLADCSRCFGVFAACQQAGSRPGGRGTFLCLVKEKYPKERRPDGLGPFASLRATCGARRNRGRARTRCAQTIARPDPFSAALLGPARRVVEKKAEGKYPIRNSNPECRKRAALPARESQQTVMFARECSARGQMKSPSIAQWGEGGVRGGSGGVSPTAGRGPGTLGDAANGAEFTPPSNASRQSPPAQTSSPAACRKRPAAWHRR